MDGRHARSLLGVCEHASFDDIRRAFRARVLATHPDLGGDRTAFELIVLAFETLQHVDIRPAPRMRDLPGVRPRFSAYDSSVRHRPERQFADALRAAMERADAVGAAR
ncbi:MAG: J domain-containing protein [Actinomycetota bacterium]|nr:J domain-containing protein [Actinomycetota bacterium]